ncbi:putative mitochondrial carrier protein [Trypanosoma theileri]|uniref:Putative mitochondrial carrier protein n=1 Tax=Trypanosoma theileri TaxID=67003 RepID=A0A1X0NUU7_9TRYP|nr:putative mitochondrial carrier protein [Trypanosoma theileri]ORC88381.1 putative mitochondrial carrier protein [Trypanosoma theileri]
MRSGKADDIERQQQRQKQGQGQGQNKQSASPLAHTMATQVAGAVSTMMLYPFDTLRIRFMSQDGTLQRQHNGQTYHSISKALTTIYREEGLRALFRGCHIAVMGAVAAWGVYMYLYRSLCSLSDLYMPQGELKQVEDFVRRSFLSGVASSCSAVVCNPIWLLKTRMQLEEISFRTSGTRTGNYLSFIRGLIHVIQTTGFFSLWRGVSAQILLGLPNAFNFPLYELFKSYYMRYTSRDNLSTLEISLCSTAAKSLVTLFAHPILVLKTRLQDHRSRCGELKYVSFFQSSSLIWKRDGLRGMYRGVVPSFFQTVPRLVMTIVLYEKFMQFYSKRNSLSN